MEAETTVLLVQGTIWGIVLICIVYLIFRRIKLKEEETFEQRDN